MSVTSQLTDLSEIDRVWLAAVLDCEGWIGMSWGYRKHGKAYWPRIGVGNTDYRLIKRLMDLTGVLSVRHYISKNPNAKEQWHWKSDKRSDVDRILKAALPYLILKREQAEAILSLPGWHVLDKPARANVHDICRRLNKKGRMVA